MKKLVFGLIGFLMLITVIGTVIVVTLSPCSSRSSSCENNACVNSETVSKDESRCVYTKTHYISGEHGQVNAVRHFEYGGHKYIQFQIWAAHGGNSGVVHDPDCPCHADKDTLK